MNAKPRTALGDLADWDLPSLEGRMDKLIDHLQKKKLSIALDLENLGEQLYSQLWDHVRELGATAANEAVAGWMQGLADGCPELCVTFAHLEGDPEAAPLTIVYSVGALDGSRMELQRLDLEEALQDAVSFDNCSSAQLKLRRHRAKDVARELRKLADKMDAQLGPTTMDRQ